MAAPIAIAQNRIIQADGSVAIKRRGWSEFRAATVGSVLYAGDLVQPQRGAAVVVLCENSTRWRVPAGVPSGVSNGCTNQRSIGLVSSLRGDLNADALGSLTSQTRPNIPYIISPRRSWVFDGQPRLQWHPVDGATQYTVRIVGPDVDWSTQVAETSVIYPGEPPLQPGDTYLLIVQADNGATSQQEDMAAAFDQLLEQDERDLAFVVDNTVDGAPVQGLGFSVLLPEETEILAQERDRIVSQGLPPESEALALADFYLRYRLMADAIGALEQVTQQTAIVSASTYHLLGSLYQHVGLMAEAELAYQRAIARATQTNDPEAQVSAQIDLANLNAQQNKADSASELLNSTVPLYEAMEDSQRKLEFARKFGETYARIGQQAIADRWLGQALDGYQALLGLAQASPQTPDSATEADYLSRQVAEIEHLLNVLRSS